MTDLATSCECGGTGKIDYVHREPESAARESGGVIIGPATTYGSRLCECRRTLEPREGEARWWESETVYEAEWSAEVFELGAEIVVKAEVPISEDNYRLVRSDENRYWPCSVDVELYRGKATASFPGLWSHEARDLAAKLIAAAEAVEAIDGANACERCGAWRMVCACKEHAATADQSPTNQAEPVGGAPQDSVVAQPEEPPKETT